MKNNLIIITGGPGSGKTTLLKELHNQGYRTFEEVPRKLIENNLKKGNNILPWVDLREFANSCYIEMMNQKSIIEENEIGFVDRAIGDIIAYLHIGGYDGDQYLKDAVTGYVKTVFLLKPDKNIYIQDEVRPHTFEEALNIHSEISKVYTSLGFQLIEIPLKSTKEQIDIMSHHIPI